MLSDLFHNFMKIPPFLVCTACALALTATGELARAQGPAATPVLDMGDSASSTITAKAWDALFFNF